VVAEAVPSPITQRGNNRQDVFLLDEDRRFYIEALRPKSREHDLTILGWCLMTNHVHLVAIPKRAESLAKAIGQAHWRDTMRFNRLYPVFAPVFSNAPSAGRARAGGPPVRTGGSVVGEPDIVG
jgi:REP element-mobilizing transposase RayT